MQLSDFDYSLPRELIAQRPAQRREASRLLHLRSDGRRLLELHHLGFADLPQRLRPRDLLVLNNTRVVRARLRGRKRSGGRVEILLERPLHEQGLDEPQPWSGEVLALWRSSRPGRPGLEVELPGGARAEVLGRQENLYRLRLELPLGLWQYLQRHGQVPLPPYIERPGGKAAAEDQERYQTVYASTPGAVAAPTAGLHFSKAVLAELQRRGVEVAQLTLHVGAGTFLPIRCPDINQHRMHRERYHLPANLPRRLRACRESGGRVVAVGTTVVRALESAWREQPPRVGWQESELFIKPGFEFRAVDVLLTNFHLPRSTLLVLVSAFAGREAILEAYAEAVRRRYRFFSYGDAMLLEVERKSWAPS